VHVLVAGCGWLGTALAKTLVARGDRVTGIRRDPARAEALRGLGVEPLALDLAAPGAGARLPARLPAVDAIVACQSSGSDTAEGYRAAYVDATGVLLAAAARLGGVPLVYTGSTGVFGQRDGSDVDETTPPAPAGPTAQVLVEAERRVLDAGGRLLRLSGLYGPGRTGLLDRVRGGVMALGPGDDAWMNWCHLDDAVAFVLAALARGAGGATYHGSDAQPPRRREVITWFAEQLRFEPARRDAPGPPGPNRRILSERTRAALGVALRYPSFREGFAGLLPDRSG